MTRKCKDIESLLSAYLENELPRDQADDVAEHLKLCPECLQKKERMEEIIFKLSDLQEEVPFFLKNRLYNIPETSEQAAPVKILSFPKWIAAAVGTVVLFLNLFYFTNVFPPLNREMHSVVSSMEKFVVRTGAWFDRVKESKDLIFFTFFNKKSVDWKERTSNPVNITGKSSDKGGQNG